MTSIRRDSKTSWSQFSAIPKEEYLRESDAWNREQRRRYRLRVLAVWVGVAAFVLLLLGFGGTADFVRDVR